MITNFYTLQALVTEWSEVLVDTSVGDAFSQEPGELSLAFSAPSHESMLRIGMRTPEHFMFRVEGYSKARRNVATLFERSFDLGVLNLEIADRDRMIFIRLEDGKHLQIALFGPRPNVLLVSDGRIIEAFRDDARLAGETPPTPRSAPRVDSFETMESRWRTDRSSVAQALSSAFPLFDRTIAAEAAHRAGVEGDAAPDLGRDVLRALYESAKGIESELAAPRPRIYWRDDAPEEFSLIELTHAEDLREETFETVDAAARLYVRRFLAHRRFQQLFGPVENALTDAVEHYRKSAERMLDELANESRADRYEKWGHLLMANPGAVPAGAEQAEVEDLYEQGETVRIPLDPARSVVENAESYYDRARRTRRSREEAERRLIETESLSRTAEHLLEDLRSVSGLRDLRTFVKERDEELARFLPDETASEDRIPFRRYKLSGGYEVWVGRNARQNDDLTFHHARKYDLWMHARGTAGSHAVLRMPNRSAEPSRNLIQQAASIAAYYSKARGSGLVPVMVTERKYVRKPRGAPPGAVAVEREDVVLVEPGLPTR